MQQCLDPCSGFKPTDENVWVCEICKRLLSHHDVSLKPTAAILQKSKKNAKANSCWGRLGNGMITVTGAPSTNSIHSWKDSGVTNVITLLRNDERTCTEIGETCNLLNISWVHLPISGRHFTSNDTAILSTIPRIFYNLPNNHKTVIHCSAGMHRSGIAAYLALRSAGKLNRQHAISALQLIRPVTAEQVLVTTRSGQCLAEAGENLLLQLNEAS